MKKTKNYRTPLEVLLAHKAQTNPELVANIREYAKLVANAERPPIMHMSALEPWVQDMLPPSTKAWFRVSDLVREAIADPMVAANPQAVKFLEIICACTDDAFGDIRAYDVLGPVAAMARSAAASEAKKAGIEKGMALMKAKALELYDNGSWNLLKDAATYIFPLINAYGKTLSPQQVVSETQLPKTLSKWLKERQEIRQRVNGNPPTR
jgi:hypothetical protein